MMAFVSSVEPLRVANRLADKELYRWKVISRDGTPVMASNKMTLVADQSIKSTQKYAKAIICAGFEPETFYGNAIGKWLKSLDHAGTAIGSIDTGSFFLAWAGLLDGYRATTHWESLDSFTEQFSKVAAEPGLFVIDRSRFTCAGGTAALDMMLYFIRSKHGHRLAAAVSEQFIHAAIREPKDRQRMEANVRQGVTHSGVVRALSLMESHLEDLLGVEDLCAEAGMSRRQLERMFHKYFTVTPSRYYLDLRLQRARALLQYSDLPIVEIAVACGFGSAAHFSRTYHSWTGKSPTAERQAKSANVTPSLL
jgi:transcriptional regulator GlxA family with amidase domain